MSNQPPPPYGTPPPGAPYGGPPPGRPRRRRPRGRWFALPGLMLVAAVVLLVLAFVSVFRPLSQEDAVIPADGSAQTVDLDDTDSRLLMGPEGEAAPTCEARDPEGGEPLPVDSPGGSFTYGDGGGSWEGFGSVDPLGPSIELTCSSSAPDAEVRVGPEPGAGAFAGFALMLIAGIALGFGGFAVLLLLAILYATGAPRKGPGS